MIPADLPEWLQPLAEGAATVRGEQLSRWLPPPEGGRQSAVLVLFGEDEHGPTSCSSSARRR